MKKPESMTPEVFGRYVVLRAAAVARPRRKAAAGCRHIPATRWNRGPDDGTAAACLTRAREGSRLTDKAEREPSQVWQGPGRKGAVLTLPPDLSGEGCDGRTFRAFGEDRMRWIEDPGSKGLRFCGLAHDLRHNNEDGGYRSRGVVNHSGWFLDPDGRGETVAGVVYQLPGKDGRARFLAGYADPFNSDDDGRGPACLSLTVYESDGSDPAEGEADAARAADGIAERMAEAEREYKEAFAAGRAAREKAQEARAAGAAWIATLREIRGLVRARHDLGGFGLPLSEVRRAVAGLAAKARAACEEWQDARKAAAEAIDESKPAQPRPHMQPDYAARLSDLRNAWAEGYAEGPF